MDDKLICRRCGLELVEKEQLFHYLNFNATHPVLVCPRCGEVYLDEELVNTKIKDVEVTLEEK